MNPRKTAFQKENHLPNLHFWLPCYFSGGLRRCCQLPIGSITKKHIRPTPIVDTIFGLQSPSREEEHEDTQEIRGHVNDGQNEVKTNQSSKSSNPKRWDFLHKSGRPIVSREWGNEAIHGCFLKWWYPQIIHFNRVFHYKPSILGYPYFWKHPHGWGWNFPKLPCRSEQIQHSFDSNHRNLLSLVQKKKTWNPPVPTAQFWEAKPVSIQKKKTWNSERYGWMISTHHFHLKRGHKKWTTLLRIHLEKMDLPGSLDWWTARPFIHRTSIRHSRGQKPVAAPPAEKPNPRGLVWCKFIGRYLPQWWLQVFMRWFSWVLDGIQRENSNK